MAQSTPSLFLSSLNEDIFRIIFSYLPLNFINDTIRLICKYFNELIIGDLNFQKEFFQTKLQSMIQDPGKKILVQGEEFKRFEFDEFYTPFINYTTTTTESATYYRRKLLDLKNKLENKIEKSVVERHQIASRKSRERNVVVEYQNYEELKSILNYSHMEPLREKKQACWKVILNGDAVVGKRSLIYRLIYDEMVTDYWQLNNLKPGRTSFSVQDDVVCDFELWDTPGQEDYDRLRVLSYPETDIVCLCFSIASTTSFTQIQNRWIPEILYHMPNVPIMLMGTKIDLRNNTEFLKQLKFRYFSKPISFEEGQKMARSVGCCTYIESSSVTGEGNIKDFSEIVAKTIIYYHYERSLFKSKKKCISM